MEQLSSIACHLEELSGPKKPDHGNLSPLWGGPASSCCPREVPLCLPAAWLATPTLRRCCAHTLEELHSPETPEQYLHGHGKSASILVQSCQSHVPLGRPPLLKSDPASPAHPWEMPCSLKEDLPTLPALRKQSTAVPGQTLPGHREYTSTKK